MATVCDECLVKMEEQLMCTWKYRAHTGSMHVFTRPLRGF